MDKYLLPSEVIDYNNPEVFKKAKELESPSKDEYETVKNCFEFVRDNIFHIIDYRMNPVTLKASDVFKFKTGYCYSKSHLLAALLRANSIPAGFCYQRLVFDDTRFCLHGLNAVYLKEYGWYRLDSRGNKNGINACFTPPKEQLAFKVLSEGEADLPEIWHEPPEIIKTFLSKYTDREESIKYLPDIEIVKI
ncbi:transglutaminase family protein [Brucepastera parasyntrophica]|uniref:transglutaminase-like domain-containing protein n=1 Tax=Brucepastera parasyntrophica TaxID=2880008 RepID=UPI00210D6A3A|nr:transglutaminase family protein [Brucepastera parasyntrophica]ULQ58573.1 transglutaminase family protein [Brucepastera parasyntrophica]